MMSKPNMIWIICAGLLALWTVLPVQSHAIDRSARANFDLAALSLEELMGVEVTLASRKAESLFETAAAVFILTGDDLRRAGVTSIPEALRLVPGMQVGHIDASKWAISARGFNDRFAQKLLVLIDGRNIYSPLFAGVLWESEDVMLEDVERIEIIRGPGATLWGANAVNGIINIITHSAADTRGGLVTIGGGSEERGLVNLRYGGSFGEKASYRIYGKYFDRDPFVDAAGEATADDWGMFRGGFRLDWEPEGGDELTWQSALYDGHVGQTFRTPILEPPFLNAFDTETQWAGGYLLGGWKRTFSATSDLRLQLYYNREHYADETSSQERDTYDLDFQSRFAWAARHDLVWGLGFRFTTDQTASHYKVFFDPASRSAHLFSGFAQDEITLISNRLSLSLGSKFEHNAYTGFECQPNARVLWMPGSEHALWAAVSRAARTPSRADDDVLIHFRAFPSQSVFPDLPPETPPTLITFRGSRTFESEKLLSYEAGYRLNPHSALLFDLAVFYNDYDDLRTGRDYVLDFQADAEIPHFVGELLVTNFMHGRTYGGELAAEWQLPHDRGRLRAAHSYLNMELTLEPGGYVESEAAERGSPEHQFYLWPSLNLRPDLQLDAVGRYVSRITDRDEDDIPTYLDYLPNRNIAAYFELDLRLAWQPTRYLELALVGQNLLHDHHPEFADYFMDSLPTETQRGVYGAATWKF